MSKARNGITLTYIRMSARTHTHYPPPPLFKIKKTKYFKKPGDMMFVSGVYILSISAASIGAGGHNPPQLFVLCCLYDLFWCPLSMAFW